MGHEANCQPEYLDESVHAYNASVRSSIGRKREREEARGRTSLGYQVTYWFDTWVGMLSEGQLLLRCSDLSQGLAREWSLLCCSRIRPQSPEGHREIPRTH